MHACSGDGQETRPQMALVKGGGRLPQVHRARVKFGLGVNQRTGRLQWCPGFTCCKFLILLPVVMLPLTLILVLLLRMDGMLRALQIQEKGGGESEPSDLYQHTLSVLLDDYESLLPESDGSYDEELRKEEFLVPQARRNQLDGNEMDKRCLPYQYSNVETLELEDHELMKDARTSFLPPHSENSIPRYCLDSSQTAHTNEYDLSGGADSGRGKDGGYIKRNFKAPHFWTWRLQDWQMAHARMQRSAGVEVLSASNEASDPLEKAEEEEAVKSVDDLEAQIIETTAALQSFWNEQGTRDGIRLAQAQTMKRYMNTKVDPCVDFYKYACGNWEKLHPIPKDKAGFDTFEMLRESLDLVLRNLLEKPTVTSEIARKPGLEQTQVRNNLFKLSEHGEPLPSLEEKPSEAEKEQAAEQLRKHIVRRRHILNQVLVRYKRKTSTKRKRLIEPTREKPKEEEKLKAPITQGEAKSEIHMPISEFLQPKYDAQKKAKDLYKSCVNIELLNKRGLDPLHQLIHELGGWPVLNPKWTDANFNWQHLAATLRRYNNDILIVQWVGADIKNSEDNIIQFDQTGLGLPTREYFLQKTNAKYLMAYQRYMSEVMHKMGATKSNALRTATELIAFETQLASITAPADQRLNVTKLYKRMTLQQLHTAVPQINWVNYLSTLQGRTVQGSEEIVIYAVEYMKQLVALLAESEPRTVANYMMWRFVRHRINNVDDRFDDIKQSFYHALFGREESPQRWKVCIAQVNTNMGMAVGSMFVSRYFDDNSKRDTLRMTHELQQAFRDILKTTEWLDPSTKQLAEEKVNAMSLKIGYPDFILNTAELNEKYAGIDIDPDRYFENTLNVLLYTAKTEQAKLHERVNKTNWQTAPAIVNAYYSRNKNQIMFPAGILQPPFYHRHFPKSLNFGGIGVVIGHELTHGFDDKGRLFDSHGNIHKWWSDISIRGFDERARCIISQYSNYTVDEVGITLNGESTQGENIADNGGLRQAFHAYKRWLAEHPSEAADESLPGLNLTSSQLFFLNFGQVWCGAMRPEAVRNKLNTAIHSPGKFRVIGTLSNSYDFAREFHCAAGTPMNPFHKCSVW